MIGTILVISFILSSFVAAVALFAACVSVARVSRRGDFAEAAFVPVGSRQPRPSDGQWRWVEDKSTLSVPVVNC